MNKKFMGAVIAVVVLIGIVTAVVLAGNKSADDKQENQSSQKTAMEDMDMQQGDLPAETEPTNGGGRSDQTDTGSRTSQTSNAVTVTISDFAYSPKTLTIKKGTTVTWTNNDSAEHTVTGDNGGPDSKLFGRGQTYSYTFDEAGTFSYFCKPHPNMTATIVVE